MSGRLTTHVVCVRNTWEDSGLKLTKHSGGSPAPQASKATIFF